MTVTMTSPAERGPLTAGASETARRDSGAKRAAAEGLAALQSEKAHRFLSIVIALVGLVVAAPLMLVIAILIKLTSPGPVLYSQARVGLDRRTSRSYDGKCRRFLDLGGRAFKIYKFRTMCHAPQERDLAVWARPNDPRVTPLGRVLRKFRLDELPQLVNVLRGDMNIVGPRPEQPRIFADLRTKIGHYHERQRVPPGITGWAQIHHHYDRSMDDVRRKVEYDLEYVSDRSVAKDLKIIARTLPVMLFQRGGW